MAETVMRMEKRILGDEEEKVAFTRLQGVRDLIL